MKTTYADERALQGAAAHACTLPVLAWSGAVSERTRASRAGQLPMSHGSAPIVGLLAHRVAPSIAPTPTFRGSGLPFAGDDATGLPPRGAPV